MNKNNSFLRTPIQHSIQYTIVISVFYIVFKFFTLNISDLNEFVHYIFPALFGNVVILVFPILFVYFYFKDGSAVHEISKNIFNKSNCDINEINTRETLREYHSMMKEGIITQEEFDTIKKKALKKLDKRE